MTAAKAARLRRLAGALAGARAACGRREVRFDVVGVRGLRARRRPGRARPWGAVVTLARTRSVALVGVEGQLVEVEADLARGLPGLHDRRSAGRGALGVPRPGPGRDRATAGSTWPQHRITIEPLAGVAAQVGQRLRPRGRRRRARGRGGAVPRRAGRRPGVRRRARARRPDPARTRRAARVLAATGGGPVQVVVPVGNAAEAALVRGASGRRRRLPVASSSPCCAARRPVRRLARSRPPPTAGASRPRRRRRPARRVVSRSRCCRRADTTCCCTVRPARARRCSRSVFPGCCPGSPAIEALEVTAVHSVAGVLPDGVAAGHHARRSALRTTRRSAAAIVGGGQRHRATRRGQPGPSRRAVPGRGAGVRPRRLDALRQPLESGRVVLHRSRGAVRLPGPVPARARRQPVPVRVRRRPVRCAGARPPPSCATSVGCPGRCSTASTCWSRSSSPPARSCWRGWVASRRRPSGPGWPPLATAR